MKELPATYQDGHLSVENEDIIKRLDLQNCQMGVQISSDGRVWICVNGLAYLRFKPARSPALQPDPVT